MWCSVFTIMQLRVKYIISHWKVTLTCYVTLLITVRMPSVYHMLHVTLLPDRFKLFHTWGRLLPPPYYKQVLTLYALEDTPVRNRCKYVMRTYKKRIQSFLISRILFVMYAFTWYKKERYITAGKEVIVNISQYLHTNFC